MLHVFISPSVVIAKLPEFFYSQNLSLLHFGCRETTPVSRGQLDREQQKEKNVWKRTLLKTLLLWSFVTAVNWQIGVSGPCSKESVVQRNALMLWLLTFRCFAATGMKCSWKQGVIMRNILFGGERDLCQSLAVKFTNCFLPHGVLKHADGLWVCI